MAPPLSVGCVRGSSARTVPAVRAGPSSRDAHYDAHRCRATSRLPVALHATRTTARRSMHHVGRVDWSFADQPVPRFPTSSGLAPERPIVGPDAGRRPHRDRGRRARCRAAGSRRHLHSFEEALYVLEGELRPRARRARPSTRRGRLRVDAGRVRHALANVGGGGGSLVRRLNTPQRLDPASGPPRHVLRATPPDLAALAADAPTRPAFGDPDVRWVGHYDGTPPQAEALRRHATRPWPARRPGWTRRSWPTAGSR